MIYEEDLEDLEKLFGTNELDISRSLSFSRLSDFDRNGPKALEKRTITKSHALMIGSLVDDMINENININDIYYRFDGQKPSATLGKLTNIILDNYNQLPSKQKVLEIVKNNNFWSSTKDEEKLKLKYDDTQFWDYLKSMYNSKGRIVVTTPDFILADELSIIVKTHNFTKHIFEKRNKKQIYYQQQFEITYNGIILKGIIDIIIVDNKNKTITLIDLKTGKDDSLDFINSFIKYRYYLQESIYIKAFESICKSLNLNPELYTLKPFNFLYISKSERVPLLYEVPEKWHNAALNGFTTSYGYEYRGLNKLIEDVKWHLDNKVFDMPRKIYDTEGHLTLNDNFIKLMDE